MPKRAILHLEATPEKGQISRMGAHKKPLEVLLTAPSLPIRVSIGDVFPVAVRVTAEGVSRCEIALVFDSTIFEETTGNSNPRSVDGPSIDANLRWQLRALKQVRRTHVSIEGRGNSLFQKSEFPVEVIVQ